MGPLKGVACVVACRNCFISQCSNPSITASYSYPQIMGVFESGHQRNTPTTQWFYRHGSTTPGRCQPAPPRTLPVWADQWFYLFRNILSATHKKCDETTRPTGKEARRTLPSIILLFYLTTNALMS